MLSRREREILGLVARGYTGVQIADELFLAPGTVQNHVTDALLKLGAKNRAHAIALALGRGELALNESDARTTSGSA